MNNLGGCPDCGNTYFRVAKKKIRIICASCGCEQGFNGSKLEWEVI